MPNRDLNYLANDQALRDKLLACYVEDQKTGCWNWQRSKNCGYGVFCVPGGVHIVASRLAYFLLVGAFEPQLQVCHHCDNRACINPNHLFLGTKQDNTNDAMKKGRLRAGNRVYVPMFNPQQDREIADLNAKGVSISEISRHYRSSRTAIYSAIKRTKVL